MRNKGIIILSLALIVLVTCVVGILLAGGQDGKYATTVSLYFFNGDSTQIVEEKREISYDKKEDIIKNIIKEIDKGPKDSKLKRIVPKGVELNNITYPKEGYAILDLNNKFLRDNSSDVLAAYTIIKSVCCAAPVTGITHIKITVDGQNITTSDGKTVDFLSYAEIKLSDTDSKEQQQVILYFANSEKEGLSAEISNVDISDGKSLEQIIIESLISGPKSEQLRVCVFGELLSVRIEDKICIVDFKDGFSELNTEKAEVAVSSIVKSLTELDTVDGVILLEDGKKIENIGNVNVSGILKRKE